MARKRMIDPAIWEDEDFGSLSPWAKILFIGLFSNADDQGRIRANLAYLKSTIFMYENNVDLAQVKDYLSEVIEKMKSVKHYIAEHKEIIQLLKWEDYQKQHKDRIQESTLPPYVEEVSDNVGQVTDNVGVSKDKLSKDKLSSIHENRKPVSCPCLLKEKYPKLVAKYPNGHNECVEYLQAVEKEKGTKFISSGKQFKTIHGILRNGFSFASMDFAIDNIKKDKFYQDKGWDFTTVASYLEKKGGDHGWKSSL